MDDAANVFFKEPTLPDEVMQYKEPVDPKELLAGLTLEKLNAIYKSIIRRQEDKVDPIRSKFGTIEKEEVSLSKNLRVPTGSSVSVIFWKARVLKYR